MAENNPYESPRAEDDKRPARTQAIAPLHNLAAAILALSLPFTCVWLVLCLMQTVGLWNREPKFLPSPRIAVFAAYNLIVSLTSSAGAIAMMLRRGRRWAYSAMLISSLPCAISCAWPFCMLALWHLSRRDVWDNFET